MKNYSISAAIKPKNLTENARKMLSAELFAVHAQIFDGVDRSAFIRYVIEPDTVLTKIFLFRNRQEEIVGYLTFQVFQPEIMRLGKTQKPFVYRTETGILPEYRGKTPIAKILLREMWKFSMRHGFPEAYFLATPINPLAYAIADRNASELYPRQRIETPAHIMQIMDCLSCSLKMDSASPSNPLLKKVGWIVKMNQARMHRLQSSDDPGIRFYLEQNPGFSEGNGMMFLAPATLRNGTLSCLKVVRAAFRTKTQRAQLKISSLLRPIFAAML